MYKGTSYKLFESSEYNTNIKTNFIFSNKGPCLTNWVLFLVKIFLQRNCFKLLEKKILFQPVPLADIEQLSMVRVQREDQISSLVTIYLPTAIQKVRCNFFLIIIILLLGSIKYYYVCHLNTGSHC